MESVIDLGNNIYYHKENDGMYIIDVNRDNIDKESRKNNINQSKYIQNCILNKDFSKIKQFIPKDAYNYIYPNYVIYSILNNKELPVYDKVLYITNEEGYKNNQWLINELCYITNLQHNIKRNVSINNINELMKIMNKIKYVCFIV